MSSATAATPGLSSRQLVATEAMLVLMSVIWGVNFAVLKYGTEKLEPLAYNGVRLAIGSLAMIAIVATRGLPRLPRRDAFALLALGTLGHGVYQLLFIQGIALTRAGTASLVVASSPALIAIVGRLLGVETVRPRAVAGIAIAVAGIAFVVLGSAASDEGDSRVIGDLMILGSVVCWAFYTQLLRPYTQRLDGVQISAWTLVGGTVPLLMLGSPAIARAHWREVTPLTWGAILYSGIASMGIAYLFWYRGVRLLGATRTAMFSNLQPIIAVGVSWPLLGERPTLWQGVGATAVLGGLLLTRTPTAPEPAHGE